MDGERICTDVYGGKIEVAITVKQSGTTAPTIAAATGYAIHGFDPAECEVPAASENAPEPREDDCYEIGLLRRGMAYRLGSAADLKRLPVRALESMLMAVMSRDHKADVVKDAADRLDSDYLRTLDEITARLFREGNSGESKIEEKVVQPDERIDSGNCTTGNANSGDDKSNPHECRETDGSLSK